MKTKVDYRLYLVTDRRYVKDRSFIDAIEEAIAGGTTLIQLREKDLSSLEFYKLAKAVRELTIKHDIPLIINDRLDIALAVNADGVHVGQDDLPAKAVRKFLPQNKILGVSASTLKEALTAQGDGADYIGVGALFPTATKKNTRKVSMQELEKIKQSLNIPVVGIGGINKENIRAVIDTGVDGVAVVSEILGSNRIKDSARDLASYFK